MKSLIILTVCLLAIVSAKSGDAEIRRENAEKFSLQDSNEFIKAWNSEPRDNLTLRSLTNSIISFTEEGIKHADKFIDKLTKAHSTLKKLSLLPTKILAVRFGKNFIHDQDYEAYYDLKAIIWWIERRQNLGVQDENLTQALSSARSAFALLQTMSDTFVVGFQTMIQESWTTKDHVENTANTLKENQVPYFEKYGDTLMYLLQFRQNFQN